ncbi:hypothetical protein HAX54_015375 [Datura stramonium]|uniref:Uncharacterized protein n=1 Tax=Datura stramonium TaxID=4076 RepID=A0ABS8S1E6_DATST|nr:hypothetical protein [Datura stramonium]
MAPKASKEKEIASSSIRQKQSRIGQSSQLQTKAPKNLEPTRRPEPIGDLEATVQSDMPHLYCSEISSQCPHRLRPEFEEPLADDITIEDEQAMEENDWSVMMMLGRIISCKRLIKFPLIMSKSRTQGVCFFASPLYFIV